MPSWAIYGNERRRGIPAAPEGIQTPDQIFGANLWAWYDASDATEDGSGVDTWPDVTNNNRDLTRSAANAHTINATAINGLPAIDWNGNGGGAAALRRLNADVSLSGKTEISVFAVASLNTDAAAFARIVGYAPDAATNDYDSGGFTPLFRWDSNLEVGGAGTNVVTTVSANAVHHFASINDGSFGTFYKDNVLVDGPDANTLSIGGGANSLLVVGAGALAGSGIHLCWGGFIAEVVIVVDDTPSTDQRNAIHAYFADKYAL
jgi:hypothetical protein